MLKKRVLLLAVLLLQGIHFMADAQQAPLIPIPVKAEYPQGFYTLPSRVVIAAPKIPNLQVAIKNLSNRLENTAMRKIQMLWDASSQADLAQIRLVLNTQPQANLGNEGYTLRVNAKGIVITANQPSGIFYGIQSLLQLMPKEIEAKQTVVKQAWKIPFAQITDYPRFAWRGLMLDVARHFFNKEQVKQFIDEMVAYKYNILHFHLTDDEGWRVEIKSFPNLTKKGAWNVPKIGRFTEFSKPEPNEPRTQGGFFTKEDIQEIVAYAKDRFVNVMPEIDVPGHSMAAIASYPELSCTPEAVNYQVISGEPFIDWSHGHAVALQDNTLCPANEKVYTFLDKVFAEVAEMFPFEYIHMGGDECPKNYWEKNPQILALMQKENLKTPQEVQAYFTRRLEKIITSKGKKMMGWDEILEGGGLPKNTAVMSWRGIAGGVQAAKDGHEVVMTPNNHVYVDLMQGDAAIEPPVYETVRLKDSYAFNPVPEGVDAKLIKGGQANLWSEQLFTYRHLQYMLFPRAWAVSEALWSPQENRNWDNFVGRVEHHFARFDQAERKYAPSVYDPIIQVGKNEQGQLWVELSTEVNPLSVHYSFDYSYPDNFYPVANGKIIVPKDALLMRMISYRGKEKVGRMMSISIEDLKKRVKK